MNLTPNMSIAESRLRLVGGLVNLALAGLLIYFGISNSEPWFYAGAGLLIVGGCFMLFEWKQKW